MVRVINSIKLFLIISRCINEMFILVHFLNQCFIGVYMYIYTSVCWQSNLGSYLEGQTIGLKSFSCGFGAGFELQWKQPSRDQDLVKGYEVSWREQTISYEKRSGTDFVGMETKYKSPCTLKLQPGRMYWTTVRTLAELQNPKENIFVEESSKYIILGKIINW